MLYMTVDLNPTDEQQSIIDVFGALVDRVSPVAQLREYEPLGFSPALWQQLVTTGAPGMGVPEADGGGGAGVLDLSLAIEALGRRLAPVPLIEHAVTARLLARAGALPGGVVDGESIATLALRPSHGRTARLVPAGAVAAHVVALDADDLVLVTSPPGALVENLGAAPLADRALTADAVASRSVLASGDDARRLHTQAVDEWRVLTAAALVGLGLGALTIAVAYVTGREQFGVPIGTFQSLQHGLADVAVALDGAQLLVRKAAWAADGDLPVAAELSAMAFLFAAEQSQRATDRALHYHGGYGFMEEYDIQLFYRRAKGWANVLDQPGREYARLADLRYGAPSSQTPTAARV
jgi:alkylation response protein AidB-like acyl-CoA dehydrogenase